MERTVGLYLQRWGYTSKQPARGARKQDPDEVERLAWRPTRRSKAALPRKMERSFGPMRLA